MHKIVVIGHLGRDPEMKYLPNGQGVTTFSVASSRKYKTASGEQREDTEWFNVSAWGRLAETCNQYLSKGQQVYLEGSLKTRSYEDRSGATRFSLDVNANEIQFLSGGAGGATTGREQSEQSEQSEPDQSVNDLPF